MADTAQIAERLDDRFTRPQLNTKAGEEYGVDDPVGYGTKGELIEAMIAADPDRAAADAGIDADASDDELDDEDLDAAEDNDDPEAEITEASEGRVLIVGNGPSNRVALFEQHRDHPGGEIFVVGGQRTEAAPTAGVQRAARDGRIRIVDGK